MKSLSFVFFCISVLAASVSAEEIGQNLLLPQAEPGSESGTIQSGVEAIQNGAATTAEAIKDGVDASADAISDGVADAADALVDVPEMRNATFREGVGITSGIFAGAIVADMMGGSGLFSLTTIAVTALAGYVIAAETGPNEPL